MSDLVDLGLFLVIGYALIKNWNIVTDVLGTITGGITGSPSVGGKGIGGGSIGGSGIIHAAMTDTSGNENVTGASIAAFNALAGKKIGAAYFTDHWFHGVPAFPAAECNAIKGQGAVPFIRMNADELKSTNVNCAAINSGKWDSQLKAYALGCKNFGGPICAEIGTEVNSKFLAFSGEGAAAFKQMHRHVVQLFRGVGATNVRWFYHGDYNGSGAAGWYPGGDIIDWIGTSMYGQSNGKGCAGSLAETYSTFSSTDPSKPLAVLEWGLGTQADNQATLSQIPTKYNKIKMMSYWNEKGSYDRRINKNAASLNSYRAGIGSSAYTSTFHDAGARAGFAHVINNQSYQYVDNAYLVPQYYPQYPYYSYRVSVPSRPSRVTYGE